MLVYNILCIVVFSYAGENLRSLIPINNLCLYFCLDSAENIIIGEHDGHGIQVFTKSGDLIRTTVPPHHRVSSDLRAQFSRCI